MDQIRRNLQQARGVGFLGNFLPRECGIATFTHDLSAAIAKQVEPQPVIVAAMNDIPEGYQYSVPVTFELRQGYPQDYISAADYFNISNIDVVSVQHEYGIYGGDWGSHVLAFMKKLKKPSVVTCHTVFENPRPIPREILREIAGYAGKLVVMSERAVHFLTSAYHIPKDKIACIPHGIHDMPFIDPSYFKDKFNTEGKRVLLTFGLLRREKGIEYVIRALPKVVARHPNTAYIVLGATHPAVVRKEGEAYRLGLQRLARELGVEKHVHFHPQFVDLDGLLEYIGAADIFVTPYLHLEQITSGALAYAMGTGKAVVSTPYWHAEELLADNRGILVPPKDDTALANAIIGLLGDETKLAAMRKRAYLHCRDMVWSAVAGKYIQLFEELRCQAPSQKGRHSVVPAAISATQLPTPSVDHLLRMCDDTGPARYARYSIPDWQYGYHLDDTCGTLVAAISHFKAYHDERCLPMVERCMGLLQTLVSGGGFHHIKAGLTYDRQPMKTAREQDAAKVLWALGHVMAHGPDHYFGFAVDLFNQILPSKACTSAAAAAYVVLGTAEYLNVSPGATFVRRAFVKHFGVLNNALLDTNWISKWGDADWPLGIQAYAKALALSEGESGMLPAMINELNHRTRNGTVFLTPGENAQQEEMSVTAGAYIAALSNCYNILADDRLLPPVRAAMDWYLGANRHSLSLYDFTTRGCHDALNASGLNKNQSTQATVHFLRGLLSIHQVDSLRAIQKKKTDSSKDLDATVLDDAASAEEVA
ncbi:MAG: glycosyltransferase family 4 protein [Deltaproteobacteria bacterium]|nr:glycosyltransferase family 4 protein [Deltaproteobacteria bacterium]